MTEPASETVVLEPADDEHPVTRQDVRDGVQLAVYRLFDRHVPGSEREVAIAPADDGTPRTTVVSDLQVFDLGSLKVKVEQTDPGVLTVTARAKPAP